MHTYCNFNNICTKIKNNHQIGKTLSKNLKSYLRNWNYNFLPCCFVLNLLIGQTQNLEKLMQTNRKYSTHKLCGTVICTSRFTGMTSMTPIVCTKNDFQKKQKLLPDEYRVFWSICLWLVVDKMDVSKEALTTDNHRKRISTSQNEPPKTGYKSRITAVRKN